MSPRENDDSKHAAITTPTPTPTRTSSLSASSSSVVDFTRRDSVETMLLRHEPCDDDEHCMRPSDLLELRLLDGNDVCIDCGRADPEWACTSLGIFLCLACSGQHRALGTHVSKVRSVQMDSWSDAQLELMKCGGNRQCVNFLKEQGLRQQHSIAERYDCAAALWYHEILTARRDGRDEPTEPPNYTPTRRKEISKEGLGSRNNSSHHHHQQQQQQPQQTPRNALLDSFNASIQTFFNESNSSINTRNKSNHKSSPSAGEAGAGAGAADSPASSTLTTKSSTTTLTDSPASPLGVKPINKNEVLLDKAMGLLRMISTKIPSNNGGDVPRPTSPQ